MSSWFNSDNIFCNNSNTWSFLEYYKKARISIIYRLNSSFPALFGRYVRKDNTRCKAMNVRSTTLPISWTKNTASSFLFRRQTTILQIIFPSNENIEVFEILSPSYLCICRREIIFKNLLRLYYRINKCNNLLQNFLVKDSASLIVSKTAVKAGYFSNNVPRNFVLKQN